MEKVGIKIIETKIKKLRDSNPTYSSPWRTVLQFLPVGFIKLPNPFSEVHEKVGLDSYLTLINFKANHRKVIVSDYLDENGQLKMSSLVTSANPHDGSSAHHNVAIKIDDFIWRDIIDSEYSVIDFSSNLDIEKPSEDNYIDESGDVNVQLLTEEKIRKSIINEINNASEGDNIKMVMFYISDRKIIKSIKRAYDRGVDIEIILDPNKDAFGREKNGVPNVSVAREFKNVDEDFKIKWCNTHGEQCHSKLLIINKNESNIMFIGSANFTKRNIGDYNLETNIKVWGTDVSSINEANNYFSELWNNKNREYTVDYGAYKDESLLKYIQYRFMEKTGISSF
jgi:phosphatidylserine/phosphatidylglycerophosphate/cardiolipin synthase-like enzyme